MSRTDLTPSTKKDNDVEVTRDDQVMINSFGRLTLELKELEAELKDELVRIHNALNAQTIIIFLVTINQKSATIFYGDHGLLYNKNNYCACYSGLFIFDADLDRLTFARKTTRTSRMQKRS